MEKQKIFWVILSVTVFVVVVLVVGVFLLKKEPAPVAAAPTTPSAGGSLFEFGREAGSVDGDTEVLRFVIGGEGAAADAAAGTAADGATPSGAATPAVEPPAPEPATAAAAAKPAAAEKPAASTKPPAATAAAPASGSAAVAAAKPSAAAKAGGVEYWIQTGSYKSQSRAEELSQALAAKGLAGRVFSFPGPDATYFRVRIGPYADKQEAQKFLAIVRKMQGLEASYISQVSPGRSAN